MEAFRLSLEAGVDGIELDVHRCASGQLVVIHDDDVDRTTNGTGLVKDLSYAELAKLDAGSWFDPRFAAARIPTLNQVLDLLSGKIILNIELKNTPIDYPGIGEEVLRLLEDYPRDTIIISSFDHKVIKRLSQIDGSLNLAVLADALLLDINGYARELGAKYWHPCFGSLREDGVREAHAAGLKINTWTVNKPRDWRRAMDMRLEGICTDDPQGLMDMLECKPAAASAEV
jgi:glycerophosphoryl diester phosphodiesterase